MAEKIQEVVRCKRFELVDDEGRIRVRMGVIERDVDFEILDENGNTKLDIEYDGKDDDIGIFLIHKGSGKVSLGVDKNGKPYFLGDFKK